MSRGKVLVTGATGFIGREVCVTLARAGWHVRALRVHSLPVELEVRGIEWRAGPALGPQADWSPLLSGGVTAVVHLAGVAHRLTPRDQVPDAVYDMANHAGTKRLAEQAVAAGSVNRFIFVSSIGAVTAMSESPVNESTPCRPQTAYGRSKLAAEIAVRRALAGSTVDWCILRPPLVYGPGNPGNMARLLRLLTVPIPLPLGSVRNRRTLLFVGNLVDAIKVGLEHPGARNQVFCLGDIPDLSTTELLRRLSDAAGQRLRLIPCPQAVLRGIGRFGSFAEKLIGRSTGIDAGAVEKLCGSLSVDSRRFREACDWHAPFNIDEALQMTVRSLRV